MVTAPKCKRCGTAHWSAQPCKGFAAEPAARVIAAPVAKPVPVVPVAVEPDELTQLRALAAKDAERKAKAAAYMRRYRAKAPK